MAQVIRQIHPVILCATIIVATCLPCSIATATAGSTTSDFRNGDIIFQTKISGQSEAIQLATHSKYSHMGILFQNGGRWFVYEAVGPVKESPSRTGSRQVKDLTMLLNA